MFYPRLNFALIDEKYTDFEKAKFVVVSATYEVSATYRGGCKDGPPAIISASQYIELYDDEINKETFKAGIHTLPDVIPALGAARDMVDRLYSVTKMLLKKKKVVCTLGGDHSVSIGVVKAYMEKYPGLSVLQFDAHSDTRDEYEGSKLSGATTMRRIHGMGVKITQVGLRSLSKEDMLFAKKENIKQYNASDLSNLANLSNLTDQILEGLGDKVYITFDVDFFDPSIMSATGTPEPGGPGWYDALTILKKVAQEREIVGFDVVELAPDLGPHACTFTAAKLVYKIMGYILAGKN
ncbi:agmatinase [Candidatus Daviesbacteria bacterium RIFOXYD1_FULL_41_10]|uniref:Agmatinase n=1 Tax=Candidatus Daviesbacteria bacterium RIFOXYD1_FULL_41_10 TaxID=1797801 RepID=A0A1F5N0S2_9BACT|nr:MAG: agmatinase [Candidatus Daviesbacteria bacterium RIFOXYD1_FULL_41_10]